MLEQIALRQEQDPVTVAFGDRIAKEILMHSSKEEKLLPIHVISVLDSLIRVDKTL